MFFFSLLELKFKACRIVIYPVLSHCGFYHFMHRVNNKLGHSTFKKKWIFICTYFFSYSKPIKRFLKRQKFKLFMSYSVLLLAWWNSWVKSIWRNKLLQFTGSQSRWLWDRFPDHAGVWYSETSKPLIRFQCWFLFLVESFFILSH